LPARCSSEICSPEAGALSSPDGLTLRVERSLPESSALQAEQAAIFRSLAPASTAQDAQAPSQPSTASIAGLTCREVKGATGTAVIVCLPEKDGLWGKFVPNAPSVILGLIAAAISLRAFFYNRSKDSHARAQSINDDYWLRKVLSPSTTEPFLVFASKLWVELPPVSDGDQDEESVFKSIEEQLKAISVSFGNFKVVDPDLATSIREHVDSFQDRLTTYRFQLKLHREAKGPAPSRPEALEELAGIQHGLLRCIKNHQGNVKADARQSGWLRSMWPWRWRA